MGKYNSNNHQKYRVKYHLILSTKYRRKCLIGIKEDIINTFKYSESISDYTILHIVIDKNRIHLLIKFKPNLSIEQVVRRLKSVTTNELWKNNSEHLKKFYWKNNKILWTNGYFVETVGVISEDKIV
jgi:putative transposase